MGKDEEARKVEDEERDVAAVSFEPEEEEAEQDTTGDPPYPIEGE